MFHNFFFQIQSWLRWHATAQSWRRTHPPHIFRLFEGVQKRDQHHDIEEVRRGFCTDPTALTSPDAGAGSRQKRRARTVANTAKIALKSPKEAAQMAALARGLNAKHILELGTCLGITTAYLAKSGAHVTTIEADPTLADCALKGWKQMKLTHHIELHVGTFLTVLPQLMQEWTDSKHVGFDLIFIDGHHEGEALMQYVHLLKPWLKSGHAPATIICDDIRWSKSMWGAWEQLAPEWPVSIDAGVSGWLIQGPRLTPFHKAVRI